MTKVIKYVVFDVIRNKFVIGYALLLFLLCFSFFGFEQDSAKGLLSILNINMIVVPLVSVIFQRFIFTIPMSFWNCFLPSLFLAKPSSLASTLGYVSH